MRVGSRDGVCSSVVLCCFNGSPPVCSRWSIIYERIRLCRSVTSQPNPFILVTIQHKWKWNSLEASDGSLDSRVGGLHPLIAMTPIFTTNFRVAEFQMEVSLSISVVFQLIKNWKQIGIGVFRIFAPSILLAREQSTSSIVVKYLLPSSNAIG